MSLTLDVQHRFVGNLRMRESGPGNAGRFNSFLVKSTSFCGIWGTNSGHTLFRKKMESCESWKLVRESIYDMSV